MFHVLIGTAAVMLCELHTPTAALEIKVGVEIKVGLDGEAPMQDSSSKMRIPQWVNNYIVQRHLGWTLGSCCCLCP